MQAGGSASHWQRKFSPTFVEQNSGDHKMRRRRLALMLFCIILMAKTEAFHGCEFCSEHGCVQDVQKVFCTVRGTEGDSENGENIWRRKNPTDLPDCETAQSPLQSQHWVCEKDGKMCVFFTHVKNRYFFEGKDPIPSSGPLPLDKCPTLKNNTLVDETDGGDVKNIAIGVGIGVATAVILLAFLICIVRICRGKRPEEVRSTGEECENGTAECEETSLNGGTP
ncbi:hypothetical protein AAFF_G00204610 [Aldrovandia affinis]|uniref:Uncharacterized protein n=1 Tax=Aldrovandia affinis TaxID=143900 RepID=A0AAD7RI08_9TELE|nr:hypothetical protein AAFF_G00204610 [Aldrovandia affinis]